MGDVEIRDFNTRPRSAEDEGDLIRAVLESLVDAFGHRLLGRRWFQRHERFPILLLSCHSLISG